MDNDKMEVVDLIINILQEHEETLEKITTKIENLILLRQSQLGDERDFR